MNYNQVNSTQGAQTGKTILPIRVLHCVAGMGMGGYENFIMNIYRNIDRQKVQFDFILSFSGVFCDEILSLGGKIYKIPFITQVGPFEYRKSIDHIIKAHREYRIIHSHMDKFSGLIMEVAKNNNIKCRIAHSHSTKNDGGIIFNSVKNFYGTKIEKNATDFFACSQSSARWLFPGKLNEAVLVNNGIDLSKFKYNMGLNIEQRKKYKIENKFIIGHIGRFSQSKNHKFIIEVFSQLSALCEDALLILVGDGKEKKYIEQIVNSKNLQDKVIFMGLRSDVSQILQMFDVFVFPSVYEGFPIALIEAQAAGVPCIVSQNITREAKLTSHTKFLPISGKKIREIWVKEILKMRGKKSEIALYERLKEFDIEKISDNLMNFYISKA
ncbi:MAG: glycosyltransferase family 1 protein [Oscillospiraceae bacterium]